MAVRGTIYLNNHHSSRFTRPDNPQPLRLTARDHSLVAAVASCRCLRSDQIQTLFFPSRRTCNRGLARLYHHGYLDRIRPFVQWGMGDSPAVYVLDKKGAELLTSLGLATALRAKDNKVSLFFLEHTLAVNDVRIAIEQAARLKGFTLEVWLNEHELRQQGFDRVTVRNQSGKEQKVPITPDTYFVLVTARGRGHFFLEVDRSTETVNRTWRRKILAYKEYVVSGNFHRCYGVTKTSVVPRILTATLSAQRAQNLKEAAESFGPPQTSKLFLFAPLSAVTTSDPLASPIWLRAGLPNRHTIL